jgi:GAF domain
MSEDTQKEAGVSYVDRVLNDAQRYTRELLDENHRLRELAFGLEEEKRRLSEQLQAFRDSAERFDRQQADLQQRLQLMQSEGQRFAQQFVEVERQNSNLANLYVASYQLVGTLDRGQVLRVIQEILANLVGSEETAVLERAEDGTLALVDANGVDAPGLAGVGTGTGVIARVAASGETWIAGDDGEASGPEAALTACIPLKLEDRVTGAIAIFHLLPQKNGLEPVDRELFDLLATHAAMALYCTALHARLAATPDPRPVGA